jgi:hypothetical protein
MMGPMQSLPRPAQALAGLYVGRTSRLESLLLGATSAWMLAVAAAGPVLAGVWVLLTPDHVLSREMTWDLLFNLEGAWHIEHGHVPHRDFHDPLGPLSFALTNLGFRFVGPTAMAFVIGELIALAVVFPIAVLAAAGRLAPLPAFLFAVYLGLLILQPANIGDVPFAYSFAMAYNRWAWAALTVLGLLLFVDPPRVRPVPWLDLTLAGVIIVFLFYLKITFAVAAIGSVIAALVTVRHIRSRWQWWAGLVALVVLTIAAPFNHAYLRDTWLYATSGYARVDLLGHLNVFVANRAEFAYYAVTIGLLAWLWQCRRARFEVVVSACLLTGIGMFVLSQNAQVADMPVGVVIALLAYNAVTALLRGPRALRAPRLTTVLLIVLIWPLMSVGASAKVLAGYYRAVTRPQLLMTPDTLNLRGLAVPARNRNVLDALDRAGYPLLSTTRVPPLRDPLGQAEYVETLVEAAAQLTARPQRVLVLDQVNPLPFVLGYPPPRGSTLWLSPQGPAREPHEIFDDVDVVLVPKYSSYAPSTAFLLDTYGVYLAQTFPLRSETASWTFLRRSAPRPPG